MNDSQNRKLETFRRMFDFGQAHASDFAPNSLAMQLFTVLGDVITKLGEHGSKHVSSRGAARQGTATRDEARDVLRELMEAISRIARVMSAEVPGLDDKFRMPPAGNDQLLLASARAFLADVTPMAAQFIAYELPADFPQRLADAIAALETAMSEQSSGVGNSVAARAAIEETVELGMDTKRKLDVIMKNKYANNAAVLAEWTSASHIERAPKHKEEPSSTPTPDSRSTTTGGSESSDGTDSGSDTKPD